MRQRADALYPTYDDVLLFLVAVAVGLQLSQWVESEALLIYPPTSTLLDLVVEVFYFAVGFAFL